MTRVFLGWRRPASRKDSEKAKSEKWKASRYDATGVWTQEARYAAIISIISRIAGGRDAGYFKVRRLIIIMRMYISVKLCVVAMIYQWIVMQIG